jgi:hypothetical protein
MGYSFKFNFSDSDIDFSPRIDSFHNYDKFLINEFFNSNDFEITRIMEKYKRVYGDSAYKHVMSNYFRNWRNGDRTLSNVQYERIVNLMESCLNETAKNQLEKIKEDSRFQLGIKETLTTIKKTVSGFFLSQTNLYKGSSNFGLTIHSSKDILNFYKLELNRVKELKIRNDNVFEKIYVLDKDEIEEVLNISKFIIHTKLKIQFENILKDIDTFFDSNIFKLKGINSFQYQFYSSKNKINLINFEYSKVDFNYFIINEIETNSKYKLFADNYLLEELANIEGQMDKDSVIRHLNDIDLAIFETTTQKLIDADKDFESNTLFNGSGGILTIKVDYKSIKNLKNKLIINYLGSGIFILIILFIYYLFYINDHLGVAIFLTFVFGSIFGFLAQEQIKLIVNIRKELNKYS